MKRSRESLLVISILLISGAMAAAQTPPPTTVPAPAVEASGATEQAPTLPVGLPDSQSAPPAPGVRADPPVPIRPFPPVPLPTVAPPGAEAADLLEVPHRFGYDAFKIDLANITPGPVDNNYLLSPGDRLVLRVWGELQLTYNILVTDDLYIEIPEVPGRIYVGDLALQEVKDRVRRQMATVYATYFNVDAPEASAAFVDLALAEVRDLRVLVQGEVTAPGSYTLHPSLGSIVYTLARAGGVKESGSLRSIQIRRGGTIVELDFYDFLLRGTADGTRMQVRQGDVIFVPLKRKEVTIQGEVRRPGIYELQDGGGEEGEDLESLLEIAGGFKPSASIDRLLIRRTELNVGSKTLTVNLTETREQRLRVLLQDADVITVPPTNALRADYVTVQGRAVLVPGEYGLTEGMRVMDLIRVAGGLLPDAYLDRADLLRLGTDMLSNYVELDLRKAAAGDEAHNVVLKPLDQIVVYAVRDIAGEDKLVTLSGHVKVPGPVPFSRGMRLYDLLFGRGGFQDADFLRETHLDRAHLVRLASGGMRHELHTFHLGKLLEGDLSQNLELQSGDEVVVFSRSDVLGGERFVTLSGYAKNPGRHTLLQGMRVADLLYAAGGYQDPDFRRHAYLLRGDLLREVNRGDRLDKELVRFNLGEALDGDATQNVELRSGDEVILYAIEDFSEPQYVEIDGVVNSPGRYELAANMTLDDLIIRAGGLREFADPSSADLFRMTVDANGDVKRETIQVRLSDRTLGLRNHDRLLIRRLPGAESQRVVEVTGEVEYPGRYTLPVAADRLSDVIRMAGGLRPRAFVEGTTLLRRVDAVSSNQVRVVIDLGRALDDDGSTDNLVLQNNDLLHVPPRSGTVTVMNEVNQPMTIAYRGGQGVDYYIEAAGGFTADADRDAVAVILPDGRHAGSRPWWLGGGGPEIRPGSVIDVPARRLPSLAPLGGSTPGNGGPAALSGEITSLSGVCPDAVLTVANRRVVMTSVTRMLRSVCTNLALGNVVEVEGVWQGDGSLVALELTRESP